MALIKSKFTTCGHGSSLCVKCNRKCNTCPLCRGEQDKLGAIAKKPMFGLYGKPWRRYTFVDVFLLISFCKFVLWIWGSTITEYICGEYWLGPSWCGPCITSQWGGCVHKADMWTAMPMYVREMLSSPIFLMWMLFCTTTTYKSGLYKQIGRFTAPETPRYVHHGVHVCNL